MGFNKLFQPQLFPKNNYGMASNIWGEMYSSGGWFVLILFILLFNLVIMAGMFAIKIKDTKMQGLVIFAMGYWVFYIHRNTLSFELGLIKRVVMLSIISMLLSMLTAGAIKKNRTKTDSNYT